MQNTSSNVVQSHPLLIGWRAARANLLPGLIVQIAMLVVVLSYYFYDPAHQWMAQLALLKQRWSYGFSAVAGAVTGGILPELLTIAVFQRFRPNRGNLENALFGMLLWSMQSVLVDGVYRLQAVLFGSQVVFSVVTKKMLMDQFVFNPLLLAPFSLAVMEWKKQGYRIAGIRTAMTAQFYKERTIPTLVANWGVWVPLVCVIYSLPSLLQLPLFSLALTFWVMIFTWMSRHHRETGTH